MKKLIFSGLLTLTLGMVSAKDIQQVSEVNPVTAVKTEAIVSSDIQETITSTQATDSVVCEIIGKIAGFIGGLLGAEGEKKAAIESIATGICEFFT